MSSATDWRESHRRWREHFLTKGNCDLCDGHGFVVEDVTPRNWWETGPIEKEHPCEHCPECRSCRMPITKDRYRRSFVLYLPDDPKEYPYTHEEWDLLKKEGLSRWGGERYDPWHFCSSGCFFKLVRRYADPTNECYEDADAILFRTLLFESVISSQQDI